MLIIQSFKGDFWCFWHCCCVCKKCVPLQHPKNNNMQGFNGQCADRRKKAVLRIYETYKNTGLSNRYIWKNYIYPDFGISERTFYNYLKQSA